jgi:hypothetical protein
MEIDERAIRGAQRRVSISCANSSRSMTRTGTACSRPQTWTACSQGTFLCVCIHVCVRLYVRICFSMCASRLCVCWHGVVCVHCSHVYVYAFIYFVCARLSLCVCMYLYVCMYKLPQSTTWTPRCIATSTSSTRANACSSVYTKYKEHHPAQMETRHICAHASSTRPRCPFQDMSRICIARVYGHTHIQAHITVRTFSYIYTLNYTYIHTYMHTHTSTVRHRGCGSTTRVQTTARTKLKRPPHPNRVRTPRRPSKSLWHCGLQRATCALLCAWSIWYIWATREALRRR